MFRGVTRNDDKWVYRLSSYRRTEPSNPLDGKSALLAITMNGFLRLLFQHADGQYSEVRAKLENITSFRHCITHAALGCDVGTFYQCCRLWKNAKDDDRWYILRSNCQRMSRASLV